MRFKPEISAYLRYRTSEIGKLPSETFERTFEENEFCNDLFDLAVDVSFDHALRVNVSAVLNRVIAPEFFTVRFKIKKEAGSLSCLDRYYKILKEPRDVFNPGLTPLLIQWIDDRKAHAIVNVFRQFSYSVENYNDHFIFAILIDAAAEHPRWDFRPKYKVSKASPLIPGGSTYRFEFSLVSAETTERPQLPVLSRFPNNCFAAFILTDHCDFDCTERLRIFLKGDGDNTGSWLGKGLKMTKGVFTLKSDIAYKKDTPTLEDDDYRQLIDELYRDGSEIAPHGLAHSGNIDSLTFNEAIGAITEKYKPATWIDHGSYLEYCYYMGGAENENYNLLSALKMRGYAALWSYQDTPVTSTTSLNQLDNNDGRWQVNGAFLRNIGKGNILVALHHARNYLHRHNFSQPVLSALSAGRGLLMSAGKDRVHRTKAVKHAADAFVFLFERNTTSLLPYKQEELKTLAPVIYTESAKPLYQFKAGDLFLFTTQEVVQLEDAYTEQHLYSLIKKRGIHIGHTYLLNHLPYVSGVFEKRNRQRMTRHWKKFIVALTNKVSCNDIWNPTMGEYAAYMKKMLQLSLVYSERQLIIYNKGDEGVDGLCFVFHDLHDNSNLLWGGQRPLVRRDTASGQTLVSGNIAGGSTTILKW